MRLRNIQLDGAFNFRDLGGYGTVDNRYTKWGLLYRSDSLAGLSDMDWQRLADLNISTVIDLRGESEVRSDPVIIKDNFDYYNISLMKKLGEIMNPVKYILDNPGVDINKITESILDYGSTVFDNISGVSETMNILLDSLNRGSVVFMCTAGKDRTGIIAAVTLYISGVIREEIIADYIVSNTYNVKGINKKAYNMVSDDLLKKIPDIEKLADVLDSKPETMISLLNKLDENEIKIALADAGFGYDRQKELRDLFTLPIN